MASRQSTDTFEMVPAVWFEPVVGLTVVTGGVGGLLLGSWSVVAVRRAVFWPQYGAGLSSTAEALQFVVSLGLLLAVYATVCIGLTVAYLSYREFDPGFVLEYPDWEATRWAAGLVVLAPVLVGAGTAVVRLTGAENAVLYGGVPRAFVFSWSMAAFPAVRGAAIPVAFGMNTVLLAGVVGPTVAILFHGVLQTTVRRVAPGVVAAGVTALAVVAANQGAVPLVVPGMNAASQANPPGLAVMVVFVGAAGIAYERTGDLAVPAMAYAALNAATMAVLLLVIPYPQVGA